MLSDGQFNEISILKPDTQVLFWFDYKLHLQPDIIQLCLCIYLASRPLAVPKTSVHSALATWNISSVLVIKTLPKSEGPA